MTFGVEADVMGKYEENSFITVVGNKEIHLVMRVKEKWEQGNQDTHLISLAGNKKERFRRVGRRDSKNGRGVVLF